jgi:hypothetical protein
MSRGGRPEATFPVGPRGEPRADLGPTERDAVLDFAIERLEQGKPMPRTVALYLAWGLRRARSGAVPFPAKEDVAPVDRSWILAVYRLLRLRGMGAEEAVTRVRQCYGCDRRTVQRWLADLVDFLDGDRDLAKIYLLKIAEQHGIQIKETPNGLELPRKPSKSGA